MADQAYGRVRRRLKAACTILSVPQRGGGSNSMLAGSSSVVRSSHVQCHQHSARQHLLHQDAINGSTRQVQPYELRRPPNKRRQWRAAQNMARRIVTPNRQCSTGVMPPVAPAVYKFMRRRGVCGGGRKPNRVIACVRRGRKVWWRIFNIQQEGFQVQQ